MAKPQGRWPPITNDDEVTPGILPRKFTKEERAVLDECSAECLMYRCAPLSVVFLGATQYLLKVGYLKPHPKYGGVIKSFGALIAAYLIGKFSYQSTCRQKILTKIPDSRLALALSAKINAPLMAAESKGQETKDDTLLEQQPSYDLDTNRSSLEIAKGLDDNFRPTVDREILGKRVEEDASSFQYRSYDDLRTQNRKIHDIQLSQKERASDRIPRRRPESQPWPSREPVTTAKKKNQYGDVWDE